eukprot:Protomagalhaensia_wolfi_Nauph_80__2747@NODE_2874_length_960_cov_7_019544_g2254_i0_p1_GENE_NODE_2874_length_960_cov_7_019544_g2254_i0NODE_2874_length_960_cov_7_019544_g2254_i0_p1_ORF_typecomplete_len302_score46_01Hydrolase_3/PF08282_12/6_8e36S6PP/PF05116_13/0_94S6PP/PF05116_13/0_00074HAD/PF12710_7/2_1e03HAD/PF12710_7/0_00076Trehalose_PPase/PF02358_16/1_8e03Trehalose_PPase/PF02358_16/0_32_NODE_2874_length_960_cov_7_019544_g2254_i037942
MVEIAEGTVTAKRPTWVATDIDGTFLNSKMVATAETQATYAQLMNSKISVVPSTGRSLNSLERILNVMSPGFEMRLTPGVYMHGTCVYGESLDDLVYAPPMPLEALKTFLETYYTMTEQGRLEKCTIYLQHPKGSIIDYDTPFFADRCRIWHSEQPNLVAERPLLDLLDELHCSQVSIVGRAEEVSKFAKWITTGELGQKFEDVGIRLENGCSTMLIAVSACENKAKGLKKLSERYPDLPLSHLLAIGDGRNDLDMLRMAPWSIAMGQASNLVKNAANQITAGNDENGWVKALTQIFFQQG